jgi:RecB family exonuclease
LNSSAIVFSESYAKTHWLLQLKKNKKLLAYTYINGLMPLTKVKHHYPFFLYEHFDMDSDLSRRIIPYLDYIDLDKDYPDKKIKSIQTIKQTLIDHQVIQPRTFSKQTQIIQLDKSFVPPYFSIDGHIQAIEPVHSHVDLYEAADVNEQVYAVFEMIVHLIEEDIPINHIKIINADNEDRFQLAKLLYDAGLPYHLSKPISIRQYPFYHQLKSTLMHEGLDAAKKLMMAAENGHQKVADKLLRFFNLFSDAIITKHTHLFIKEMDRLTLERPRYKQAIDFIEIDEVSNINHHHLVMNYIDERFPVMEIDNQYLLNKQKEMIGYPRSEDINQYRLESLGHLLDGLKNLILFRPKKIIDDTRISHLKLKRQIHPINYVYRCKPKSYLPTYDYLRYKELKELAENYHIIEEDYALLKSHYQPIDQAFTHQFSGIDPNDLNSLLDRKYTLTGTKIEKLNLCPFQYFMAYLLMMDDFKDNHYIYFGNQIHKTLEKLMEDSSYDYLQAISNSPDFPEDIHYKKAIYHELLIENIDEIKRHIFDFHQDSSYKKILTEESFSRKLSADDRFMLTGVIDKIMIDETMNRFIIVDYKYSKKVFSLEAFQKGRKLQLPFYLLMYGQRTQALPTGLFYRQTGAEKSKANEQPDYRLNGVFLDDLEQMKRLDPEGKHILALRYTKTGMYNYPKKISQEDFEQIQTTMRSMIYQAAKQIESGDFKIDPIITEEVNRQSISCQYCSFAHVCYSKNTQLEEVDEDEVYQTSE